MAKEWILNSAMNRFQLNFKRNVGATSESIRICDPKTIDDWSEYYFKNVKSKEDIIELGKKLYIKITEVLPAEIEEITEKDCIEYMMNMVIGRTFAGYNTEKATVRDLLRYNLGVKIEPAPDEWDRLFNVDFFIRIDDKYIGLQIKPVNNTSHISVIFKERTLQEKTHQKFESKYGGKVFYIFSMKVGDKKTIQNPEIVEEIKKEIERLK